MRALLKTTRRLLRRILIVTLVLIATVNGAAFLLTPLLDHYRDDLAAFASQRLGRPIAIGAMQARWHGFGPELVLKDLSVGTPGKAEPIHLSDVALDFGLWDMLRYRDLSPLRLTLRNLEIHLIRDHAGKLHLAGFEGLTAGDGEASKLPLSGRLRLLNVTVLWEDQRLHLPVQRLDDAQLRLHLWPDRLSMSASVKLPGARPGGLKAGADLALGKQDWSGQIYIAGSVPEAAAQLGPYLPAPLRLKSGGINLEVWSDWQASRLLDMEGRLAISDLNMDRGENTPALDLQRLSTAFRYNRVGEDRQVDLAKLVIRRNGHQWPSGNVHLALNVSQPGLPAVDLTAQYLRLGDVLAMTRPVPLSAQWLAWRDELEPDAELQDLHLVLQPGVGLPRWQIDTRFLALRSSAWQHLPGVAGLQGSLKGNEQQMTLQVKGANTEISLPRLLDSPLPVTRLASTLRWERQPNGDQLLSSQAVTLDTPDIQTSSRFSLHLPADGPVDIDLQGTFRNGDASHAERYYPVRHMSPQLVNWLKQAIHNGHVPQGSIVLRGPLKDFPFHQRRNGRFETRFDVEDLDLNYKPGWPPLHVNDAEVVFNNNTLGITLRRARIYDSQVLNTKAHLDSLDPTGPLQLHGEVQGPLRDPVRLLTESPLKARFGDLVDGLKVQGSSHLTLDFSLVLHKLGEEHLQGDLELQNAGLALPAVDVALSKANGHLAFDLQGVHASGIQASALGRPVRIDVTAGPDGHRIIADTRMDAASLGKRLPLLPADLVSGEAPLRISLDIPNKRDQGPAQQLQISSDLQGMALHLPAPLGKDADSARSFELTLPLQDAKAPLRLRYGGLLDALFRPGGDRAAIRLGGGTASLPEQPVLHISGQLDDLALDPWLALIEHSGTTTSNLPPLQTDLELAHLAIGRLDVDRVRVRLKQQVDGWAGEASAPTFAGTFHVPAKDRDAPVTVHLSRLETTLNREEQPAQPPDSGKPEDWPALDLAVDQLKINGHDFGKLTVKARHAGDTLQLQPLTLVGPLVDFDGQAQWQGSGNLATSNLTGKLHSPRLGDMLVGLGYSRQFDDAPTEAEVHLSWPGSLDAVSPAKLQGDIQLNIGQGRLLEVDPGVARVFGLLNFSALQRRLRLDFSDLFRKGLAFDQITGHFRLTDGNAYTSDLTIQGPSGEILITGRTGLAAKDLYQQVTVTPSFDATLPVAGALAGGPLTGLAVLLAQQVMKEKVDKFNRVRYEVTGSWDDPKVEQVGGGGGLSRILEPVTDLFNQSGSKPDKEAAAPGQ